MKLYSGIQLAQLVAKTKKKPVLFISFDNSEQWDELIAAAPYLSFEEHTQAISDGYAVIVCDSDRERDRLYNLTVGDDGSTELNDYKGPTRVYALTIDKNGQTRNENT